jgi:hypothetical protein
VHLSNRDIDRALNQFKHSGANYLLATTFPAHTVNSDIEAGGWRRLNLCAAPFSFPAPVFLLKEKDASHEKSLGLWRISDLPSSGRSAD